MSKNSFAEGPNELYDYHHQGLYRDVECILTRRRLLGLGACSSATLFAGCDRVSFLTGGEENVVASGTNGKECVVHPGETEGPFPADGSNRAHGTLANVLKDSGIVRRDMRPSLTTDGPLAEGVPVRLTLSLVSVGPGCVPLVGHAIYLWHCDAAGRYSVYELPQASYLRAVGISDERGQVQFETVVPGCYTGRYPHMHFEVYPSLGDSKDYRNAILTSQLAIPAEICDSVYRSHPAYAKGVENFRGLSLDRDGIFRDNTPKQLAAQTLAMTQVNDQGGYEASVTIGIKSASTQDAKKP